MEDVITKGVTINGVTKVGNTTQGYTTNISKDKVLQKKCHNTG